MLLLLLNYVVLMALWKIDVWYANHHAESLLKDAVSLPIVLELTTSTLFGVK